MKRVWPGFDQEVPKSRELPSSFVFGFLLDGPESLCIISPRKVDLLSTDTTLLKKVDFFTLFRDASCALLMTIMKLSAVKNQR